MKLENARAGAGYDVEIVASGHAYPSEHIDNDTYFERCRWPDRSARAALEAETGVRGRWWCREDELAFDLSRRAVTAALEANPALVEDIDVVLVTSSTTSAVLRPAEARDPGNADLAPLVAHALGRKRILALDLKACNCTGFVRALQVMDGLLANPAYRGGLIVSVERTSSFCTAPNNRSSFTFIFGDAAGAVVVRKRPGRQSLGLVDYVGFVDTDRREYLRFEPDGLHMASRGNALKEAAIELLTECGRDLLDRNRLKPSDVDWLLPIQTSLGVIEPVRAGLGFGREQLLWFGDTTGFSGSASIPACLAEQIGLGRIRKGHRILSVAVGAGLNAAGALYHY